MPLDLPRFFRACNPNKTLVVSRDDDQLYYIDFSSVRGGNTIRELERTINLVEDEPTCQLFTGHIGCGKSTELLRLKADLELHQFHVVYFESSQDLDMADVDVTDIMLAIARQVSESLETSQINLKPGYFNNLFSDIVRVLQTPVDLSFEGQLSVGIGKITAKTKDSPELRSQLRQYLEPRTNGILEAINQELLLPASEKLKQRGKRGLVVIVDNLDRVDSIRKPSGRTQPEYLFVERGEQLKALNCHVVYTVPLALIFSIDIGLLTNRFGVKPKVLPMVPVSHYNGSECVSGLELLQQMVLARAFPTIPPAQRLAQVEHVFDHLDTLNRLCRVSGGHVRNLLVLLYGCLQQADPPVSRQTLERVIKSYRDDLVLAVTDQQWQLLHRVATEKTVGDELEYQDLFRSLFVFEYRDDHERWFDINPALVETKQFQSLKR